MTSTRDRVKATPAGAKRPFRERRESFKTPSNIPVNRVYTPDDADRTELGFPGEFPYLRGIHPTGYRGKLWTMRMFAGFGTAEETNERFKYLLERDRRA